MQMFLILFFVMEIVQPIKMIVSIWPGKKWFCRSCTKNWHIKNVLKGGQNEYVYFIPNLSWTISLRTNADLWSRTLIQHQASINPQQVIFIRYCPKVPLCQIHSCLSIKYLSVLFSIFFPVFPSISSLPLHVLWTCDYGKRTSKLVKPVDPRFIFVFNIFPFSLFFPSFSISILSIFLLFFLFIFSSFFYVFLNSHAHCSDVLSFIFSVKYCGFLVNHILLTGISGGICFFKMSSREEVFNIYDSDLREPYAIYSKYYIVFKILSNI